MRAIRARQFTWFVAAGTVVAVAGCPEGRMARGPTQYAGRGFASRRITGASLGQVRSAAVRALRQDYRLDTEHSTGAMLVSNPKEVTGHHGPGRVRDLLGSPNRYQETAVVHLDEQAGAIVVRCQVSIQRLDTAERAAFAAERGDDRPTETPIERLGPTSPETREEWTYVGRDRQAENALLERIVRRFAATRTQPGQP